MQDEATAVGPREQERFRNGELPEVDAPPAALAAAEGASVDSAGEADALAWLLSPNPHKPVEHAVDVTIDTEAGPAKARFVVVGIGDRVAAIQRDHADPASGQLDVEASNAQMVVEGTVRVERPGKPGEGPSLRDEAFRRRPDGRVEIDPAVALRARFGEQGGLIANIAGEIQRISGYSPDRVSVAKRIAGAAAGGS